jgi:hypothetical protein
MVASPEFLRVEEEEDEEGEGREEAAEEEAEGNEVEAEEVVPSSRSGSRQLSSPACTKSEAATMLEAQSEIRKDTVSDTVELSGDWSGVRCHGVSGNYREVDGGREIGREAGGRERPSPDETRVATALLLHLTHELKCVMGQEVEELAGILTASIYSEVAVVKSFESFGLSDLPVSAPLLRRTRRGEEKECQNGVGEGERSWLDGNPLIEQLPYYDLNLRCEKQYLQGRSELAEAKQRALQDKTEILALRARVFELEQSRIGFDKEMGRITERSEKLHRDNIRWFDLYKEASSSAGGVMVELQALRLERKVRLAENALQLEAKYQEEEVSEVQQPSASAFARVASAAASQDASCAGSVVTSRAGSPLT